MHYFYAGGLKRNPHLPSNFIKKKVCLCVCLGGGGDLSCMRI